MSSPAARYLLALAAVALAFAVRMAFSAVLGDSAPFATFLIAVAAAAVFGGVGPALVSLVLGGALAVHFFVPGRLEGFSMIRFVLYVAVSAAVVVFAEIQRRRRERTSSREELLRVTLSSIGEGVISTDADGRITFINPVAAELTGWSFANAVGTPIESVYKTAAEESGVLLAKDGKHRAIQHSSAPILSKNGVVIGSVLVFRDVTAEREQQAEMRRIDSEREHEFQTLADSIPQLAWMAHPDGHIFWYNRRWYEYTGTTLSDMEGWGWQSVHDPATLPDVMLKWTASVVTGKPFDMVFPLRGADGVFRPFLTRVMPVLDPAGKVLRWFGTNTDITERQRYEDELRQRDERFRRLYDANVVGIVCVETDRVFESNEVVLKMLGQSREDLEAGLLNWRALSGPEDAALEDRALAEVTVNGYCKPFEKELIAKDGGRIPVLFGATLLQREPLQWLGIVLDLTERKRLEKKVLETQKMDSVGLLAGGVAHDFNNMLVGVIGNASLAMDMLPPESKVAVLLEQIMQVGEELAHLTRQMLAYSGKGRFYMERLNLSDLVQSMIGLVEPSISKKITVQMDLSPSLPPTEADRGQIQQVFTNLVLNASEAIDHCAGLISISTGAAHIDEGDLTPGTYVWLKVRDTGCGMDSATQARVFDPFFSTKFAGRGLGMAAVAGIVRGHKGTIEVETAPGKGSCFTVYFPAVAAAQPAVPNPPVQELRGKGTILIVDDEAMVRQVAAKSLEKYGYEVLVAASGREAVDIFKRYSGRISAVLLDMSMPEMGGVEALPLLLRVRADVRVVVSSGFSGPETLAQFKGQRIAGFLQKPYTAKTLAEAVAAAVG